jgi:hypothetical protein
MKQNCARKQCVCVQDDYPKTFTLGRVRRRIAARFGGRQALRTSVHTARTLTLHHVFAANGGASTTALSAVTGDL